MNGKPPQRHVAGKQKQTARGSNEYVTKKKQIYIRMYVFRYVEPFGINKIHFVVFSVSVCLALLCIFLLSINMIKIFGVIEALPLVLRTLV